jgi:hypothetical protein
MIKKVRSEDFSPSIVRTKVLTTNSSDRDRSIGHDMSYYNQIHHLKFGNAHRN